MEYMEFLNAVRDYINETADDVKVSIHTASKNNGVKLHGMSFSKEGCNASPTLYMENYYEEYLSGTDVCVIGDRLLASYRENTPAVSLDMSFFEDFEYVRDRLYIKLINREKNLEFLKEVPHEDYLDLAMVPYVRMYDKRIGSGIIMVRNEHVKQWGVDDKTVMSTAKANTHDHDGFNLKHILDVLKGLGNKTDDMTEMEHDALPMYVATNERMQNGAAVLAMKDKLKEFGRIIGDDYYIIPSSVHELILLGRAGTQNVSDIDGMIRQVNSTQLGEDEVLADHAYLYRLNDDVLIF